MSQSSESMNATVNWLKRRVSLSSTSTSPNQTTTEPHAQRSGRHNNNINIIITLQQPHPTANELSDNISRTPTVNIGARNMNSSHNPRSRLMQHDIIDPSSPLSILAATSKLTTFPYGELQALNARMNMEAAKINGVTLNGINGLSEINGISSAKNSEGIEKGGVVAPIPKPLSNQKTRSRERLNPAAIQPPAKSLLPSAMPSPVPPVDLAPASFQIPGLLSIPPSFSFPNIAKQRTATTSALPRARSLATSNKKSTSLSSTQNTRSSKRLKTSHPPSPTASSITPPKPKAISESLVTDKIKPLPVIAPPNKKRVLPVRQGHIDILDGEISLLSTPQRLDSITP